jgi:hypothetical protein
LQGCKRVVVIGIHGWFPGTSADILLASSGWNVLGEMAHIVMHLYRCGYAVRTRGGLLSSC